eukprot:2422923-Pyramimonas_sp.AAC.1
MQVWEWAESDEAGAPTPRATLEVPPDNSHGGGGGGGDPNRSRTWLTVCWPPSAGGGDPGDLGGAGGPPLRLVTSGPAGQLLCWTLPPAGGTAKAPVKFGAWERPAMAR